jgi:hypothetical protein
VTDSESQPATWADVREGLRQNLRWSRLGGVAWIAFWGLALDRLQGPDLTSGAQLFWCVAPLILLPLALWTATQKARSMNEMERHVTDQALRYAFPLTLAFYAGMGLVNVVFPLSAIRWATSWILPLLLFTACWIWAYRRFNPR